MLLASLQRLTDIVSILASDKTKKAKSSKIDQALDGISLGSGSESSSTTGGKRAAAARRALRQALVDHPSEVSTLVERLLMEDLTSQVRGPGMPEVAFSARAWVEHRSRIGAYKTSAYCAWGTAGVLDDLVMGRVPHARAKAALMLLQLDQTAIDRGSWAFSSELSLEQGPPFAALSGHVPPAIAEGESPFSKLLDGRWAEISLAHLRDTEDFVTKRRNLGRKTDDADKEKADKIKPKAKAKTKPSESHGDA